MEVPDNSVLDLIDRVRSWISWGSSDFAALSSDLMNMDENGVKVCYDCQMKFTELCHKYNCQTCGRLFCGACVRNSGSLVILAAASGAMNMDNHRQTNKAIKFCKLCLKGSKRHVEKVYPSDSPRGSPEPPSPSCGAAKICCGKIGALITQDDHVSVEHGVSSQTISCSSLTSSVGNPSPISVRRSAVRSDEDESEDSAKHFCSLSSEYYHDSSDVAANSLSVRQECYSFMPSGSSPADSPSRININEPRGGHSVQREKDGSPKPRNDGSLDREKMIVSMRQQIETREITHGCSFNHQRVFHQGEEFQKPLDFENNGHIWFPPPPEDEEDEAENIFYEDDDDDDGDTGDSGGTFSSISCPSLFPAKEKPTEGQEEPLKCVIQGHFRALVSQLLQGEGFKGDKDNENGDWMDIVSTLAWQAANFVRPDTSKGGSMDPVDYVKVKCVASGIPSESALVKGVVCTKNIKHKRMTTQYKNPRLLLLGGSLEYQRLPNELASFNTLLEEEMNHLKAIVSKIEALQTNVLLVEKSVSSYAQEYLLAKEISLVLNVKRPVLERIARCTGALIAQSVGNISAARVGHCELFRLEKISEDFEVAIPANKRPSKTLMYFEGCPRRLGCTVLLKGSSREELKKLKHVVQYAVFAAYHLSLETSFLTDEGATLPNMTVKSSPEIQLGMTMEHGTSNHFNPDALTVHDVPNLPDGCKSCNMGFDDSRSCSQYLASDPEHTSNVLCDGDCDNSASDGAVEPSSLVQQRDMMGLTECFGDAMNHSRNDLFETGISEEINFGEPQRFDGCEVPSEYFSATDSQQSILVSFSSRCVLKGATCERSRLLRIKFYGSFDKPLGRYLREDIFNQVSYCRSCKEPVDAHVQCFTHQLGNLTINVRRLSPGELPGEQDGKIWMWHRCLKCAHVDGIPPATRRVVMSDAAWGLSFGKFLELSFSNHATANRVANCGHSLQRDCLRFYGFGSMVVFFHYSAIEILSVQLPPSILDFSGYTKRKWIKNEAAGLNVKVVKLYREIADVLRQIEQKCKPLGNGSSDSTDLHRHILELKDLLHEEQADYCDLLGQVCENASESAGHLLDILELNSIRRSLLVGSDGWNRRLYSLDSLLTSWNLAPEGSQGSVSAAELKSVSVSSEAEAESKVKKVPEIYKAEETSFMSLPSRENDGKSGRIGCEKCIVASCQHCLHKELQGDAEVITDMELSDSLSSTASNLSDKIDSAWSGTEQNATKAHLVHQQSDTSRIAVADNIPIKRRMGPTRMYSFDSATRLQERITRGLPPSALHLSTLRSFHGSGDYKSMVRGSSVLRTYSQPREAHKLTAASSYITSAAQLADGARLLLPQTGQDYLVVAVYDDEPTSVVSYALSSKEHEDWVSDKLHDNEGSSYGHDFASREEYTASPLSPWQSFGSADLDYIHYGSFGSEDATSRSGSLFGETKKSSHLKISFEDESNGLGRAKFSVTCYFAKQFDMFRKKCCPTELEFVCSLSRCKRWSAQGGKSNVYFAKSMDERFIIKQVTKTELDSFVEFAPDYFRYMTDSVKSGSPTCLAKVLGIYQVSVKQLKGGRETKMDLMVMENLFFNRHISRVYDLKGSSRSRYNADSTGLNKVLLDMNLLETLRTNPMFLGSKAKRKLERAVWNDTSFLASVDVMDYSLLVGVDEERKELVLGIIDYMRQYTWDKQLETWVKASGILGGPKNAPPTIISPMQYKKRFRKAMTAYFLTVPDQWSS